MSNLSEFVEWSKNNPYCSIDIRIGGYYEKDAGKIRIFVYSSKLGVGQAVTSVDEIDLDAEYKKKMEQKKQEVEKYFQKEGVV